MLTHLSSRACSRTGPGRLSTTSAPIAPLGLPPRAVQLARAPPSSSRASWVSSHAIAGGRGGCTFRVANARMNSSAPNGTATLRSHHLPQPSYPVVSVAGLSISNLAQTAPQPSMHAKKSSIRQDLFSHESQAPPAQICWPLGIASLFSLASFLLRRCRTAHESAPHTSHGVCMCKRPTFPSRLVCPRCPASLDSLALLCRAHCRHIAVVDAVGTDGLPFGQRQGRLRLVLPQDASHGRALRRDHQAGALESGILGTGGRPRQECLRVATCREPRGQRRAMNIPAGISDAIVQKLPWSRHRLCPRGAGRGALQTLLRVWRAFISCMLPWYLLAAGLQGWVSYS